MAATKITIPINLSLLCVAAGLVLAVFSAINLFASFTPAADQNQKLADDLTRSLSLPFGKRVVVQNALRTEQETLLARNPADPFGWARLAYLRRATAVDATTAFAALRMSDMVSPYEPRQLLERALMWRELRDVQTDSEKEYQRVLWQKAYARQRGATLKAAHTKNLDKELEAALPQK